MTSFCGIARGFGAVFLGISLPFLAGPVWAFEIKSRRFEPSEYYIGRRVQLILEVELEADELPQNSEIPVGAGTGAKSHSYANREAALQQLPRSLDYRVYSVKMLPRKQPGIYTIILNYALFSTEIQKIAPFAFQGLAIPGLSVPRARSSLALDSDRRTEELPPLESRPLSLPWIDLSMALLIQLLVLLPILIFQGSRRVKRWITRCYESYLDKKPYRRLLRQLNILQQKEDQNDYYRILSSQLRYYLSQRTHHPCSAYTTEELAKLHIQVLPANGDLWGEVLSLLRLGDDLRFRSPVVSTAPEAAQRSRETRMVIRFVRRMERLYQRGGRKRLHA